jgi:hypothetical protein
MIKEFFTKLTSWNSEQNKEWKRTAAQRLADESQREKSLAKEREETYKQNMRAEGVIPRIDVDGPTGSQEKNDQVL